MSEYKDQTSSQSGVSQLLIKQVELDLKLRPFREQFDSFRNENKWKELTEYCQARGMKCTREELECWIKISYEEFDPFRSTAVPTDFPYRELVSAFSEAKTHW